MRPQPRVNANGEYLLCFRVQHMPPGALTVLYEFIDDYDHSINKNERFREIKPDKNNFECRQSFYGDVVLRAGVWYEDHGLGR